jgi:hypothetical protein
MREIGGSMSRAGGNNPDIFVVVWPVLGPDATFDHQMAGVRAACFCGFRPNTFPTGNRKTPTDATVDRFFHAVYLLGLLAALGCLSNQFRDSAGRDARLDADRDRDLFGRAAVEKFLTAGTT